jgi:hypothetical protein
MSQDKPDEKTPQQPPHVQEGGIQFHGDVKIDRSQFAGRDLYITQQTGISAEEFNQLFDPLLEAIRQAPAEVQEPATQEVEALKEELSKGDKADDNRVAKLVDNRVGMVPGAVSAVASMFATPLLKNLVGPVTQFVLGKLVGG